MTSHRSAEDREAPREGGAAVKTLLAVLVAAAVVQIAVAVWTLNRMDGREAGPAAPAAPAAAPPAEPPREPNPAAGEGTVGEKLDALRSDLDFLASDVQRMERKLDDLTAQLENRGVVNFEPQQPPELDWTEPELFETARRGAESVGLTLTADELRAPAKLVLIEGPVEYFAVLKGGKEHETVLSIVGNTPAEARRPKDMGVKLNNALQALGFRRGRPIRFGASGTSPAQGETIHMYVEWTTGGKTEVVRAEDLVFHRVEGRTMNPGSWVYVGSLFLAGESPGELDYAADLTAEVAATYSAPATIVDNTDTGAQDDTVFLAATPRMPKDVEHCTLIFRRKPLTEFKTFPPIPGGQGGGDAGGDEEK